MLLISRQVDQLVMVGKDIFVRPTDVDSNGARLIAEGRMMGGPEDGGSFRSVHELAVGRAFAIGPNIVVTLLGVVPDQQEVRLGIDRPAHVPVMRKEVYDQLRGPSDSAG